MAAAARVPVWFEPVSVPKAGRVAGALHVLEYISPNAAELIAISEAVARQHLSRSGQISQDQMRQEQYGGQQQVGERLQRFRLDQEEVTAGGRKVMELEHHLKRVLEAGIRSIVLTLGADGAAICSLR